MKKILISIFCVTLAFATYAVENDVKNTDNVKSECDAVDSPAENGHKMLSVDEEHKADAAASVPKERQSDKSEKSDNSWKWIVIVAVVAAIGYSVYRRKIAPTVITFDSLVDYAELAKNSGAASVNAFRLGSMSNDQQRQVMSQFKLGYKFKIKGYKPESTLVVVQMDDDGKVLDQVILCGHQFDEKLSIAISNNNVLTINLK